MDFRDWIIVAGVVAAIPIWAIAVRHQWSRRPGSTGRMLKSCAAFAAMVVVTMFAAYLAS